MSNEKIRQYFSPEKRPTQESRLKQAFVLKRKFLAVWDNAENPKKQHSEALQILKEELHRQSGLKLIWETDEAKDAALEYVRSYSERMYGTELVDMLLLMVCANKTIAEPLESAVKSGYIEDELCGMFGEQTHQDIRATYELAKTEAVLDVLGLLETESVPLMPHRKDVLQRVYGEGTLSSDGSVSYVLATNISEVGILYTYPKDVSQPQLSFSITSL